MKAYDECDANALEIEKMYDKTSYVKTKPRTKEEQSLTSSDASTTFGLLSKDTVGKISRDLSFKDIISALCTSKMNYGLFYTLFENMAWTYVVEGNLDALKVVAKRNPEELFKKGNVTDPRGRIFYNVSAYQLINFLCDDDMKKHIMSLITDPKLIALSKVQDAQMGRGGADLIKIDRDPLLAAGADFKGITEFKTTYTLFDRKEHEVTFPLLENPDGIIYYQDENKVVHFYYANPDTKELKKLEPCITSEEEQQAWNKFISSFDSMENNSGRRSSDAEHQLIAKILQHTLHRQGIGYEHHGVRYRDSHSIFNLIHAYRKCIRLYQEAEDNDQWDKANAYWRESVGKAQGEEMWLLQRICEKNRLFYPLQQDFNEFQRGFEFYNWNIKKEESVFSAGQLVDSLGSNFALYKARRGPRGLAGFESFCSFAAWVGSLSADLIAVNRLVEDAKANIIELKNESSMDWEWRSNPKHCCVLL